MNTRSATSQTCSTSVIDAHDRAKALELIARMGGGEQGARKLRSWATNKLRRETEGASQKRLASYVCVADELVRVGSAQREATDNSLREHLAMVRNAIPVAERVVAEHAQVHALPEYQRREVLNAVAEALATTPPRPYSPDAYFNRVGFVADRYLPRTEALRLTRSVIGERTRAGTLPTESVFALGPGDIELPPPNPSQDLGHPELYMDALTRSADPKSIERALARLKLEDPARAQLLERAYALTRDLPGQPHGLRRVAADEARSDGALARSGVRRDVSTTEWRALYRAEDAPAAMAAHTEGMVNQAYGRSARVEDGPSQWLVDPAGRYVVVRFHGWNSCD